MFFIQKRLSELQGEERENFENKIRRNLSDIVLARYFPKLYKQNLAEYEVRELVSIKENDG